MKKIILDTNFLLYCSENKIDYANDIMQLMDEGYELIVPSSVVKELEELSKNSKKLSDRSAAFLAIKLLEHNKVKVVETYNKYADEAIIDLIRTDSIVATLDLELRKKLRNKSLIVIKGNKKIAFE
jgi:rRNA-processing protein FCF1